MRIRRFEARDMREALTLVKKEFGPEAVILSVQKLQKKTGFLKLGTGTAVVVTAAIDSKEPKATPAPKEEPHFAPPPSVLKAYEQVRGIETPRPPQIRGASPIVRPRFGQTRTRSKGLYVLWRRLLHQGVDEAVTLTLVKEVQRRYDAPDTNALAAPLTEVIAEMGVRRQSLRFSPGSQRLSVFVGPSGVGKTTTVAKLAAAAQSSQMRDKIAWLTLDTYKVGALAESRVYGAILGIPVEMVSSRRELLTALKKFKSKDLVLIDTTGIGPRDEARIGELRALLSGCTPPEVHLVMNASTRDRDFQEIGIRFSELSPTSVIFTKMDECIGYGGILNHVLRTKIPLSYFATGQAIPDDIQVASIQKLAALLVQEDPKYKEWSGPPEVLARRISDFEDLLRGTPEDAERAPLKAAYS